jgi:cation diffusion facilitator family transporter
MMMIAEIVGGALFGSIALIADGFHMSTHAGALLLGGLAYRLARRHADDPRLTFGSGKFGDLAGFASAILLAAVGAAVAYEALTRLVAPRPIAFAQAIPIAALGLIVNVASAWLLTRGGHDHGRAHGDGHDHALEGNKHAAVHRDNAMRSAVVHVLADAAVSIAVISGLVLARVFGWLWMDPAAALIGAAVIVSWSFSLIRDTGAVLLDVNPEPRLAETLRKLVEADGDALLDCHIWRLGPGHLGAILSIATTSAREASDYRAVIAGHCDFSHLTIEVERKAIAPEARSRTAA